MDFWIYDWYPPDFLILANPTSVSGIIKPYLAHAVSPNRGKVKRALILQSDWVSYPDGSTAAVWSNLTTFAAWFATEFSDPSYMRIDGKPVIGLFNPTQWHANANTQANYFNLLALLPTVYSIGYGSIDTTAGAALKLNALTAYDGSLGANPTPVGQHPWSDQVTKDQSNAGQPGFDIIETVSVVQDGRSRHTETTVAWSDSPTIPDQITALSIVSPISKVVMLSPWSELDEAGPLVPTVQDGYRYLDPVGWVRGTFSKPGSYTYNIDARQKYAVQTGTWTRTNGQAGAYDGDYITSSTTADTIALTCDLHVLGTTSTGSVEFMCAKGPTSGIADFLLNGVSQGTVDLGNASSLWFQSVKTITVNLGDTITFKVNGSHSVGSTNAVSLDTFRITYVP